MEHLKGLCSGIARLRQAETSEVSLSGGFLFCLWCQSPCSLPPFPRMTRAIKVGTYGTLLEKQKLGSMAAVC